MLPSEYKRRALHNNVSRPGKWSRREGSFTMVGHLEELPALFAEMEMSWQSHPAGRWRLDRKHTMEIGDGRGQTIVVSVEVNRLVLCWQWRQGLVNLLSFEAMTVYLGTVDLSLPTWHNMHAFEALRTRQVFWDAARNAIAWARYARGKKKWDDVLPADIVQWAHYEFAAWKLDCMDNTRVALLTSSSQKRRFKKQAERGCCGSHSEVRTGPDGKKYLLGCNYGH
jgi:hypothetical protein